MGIDAIIVSDLGEFSFSSTNPLKLKIDEQPASIQRIRNFVCNQGQIADPFEKDNRLTWASAPRLNGIYIYDFLAEQGFKVELINSYSTEKKRFTELLNLNPRAVILSTSFIPSKKILFELAEDIRSVAPDIFIIAGGPFVYYSFHLLNKLGSPYHEFELLKDDFLFIDSSHSDPIDLYIISLRGESILGEALARISKKQSLDDLPNTARYMEKKYIFGTRIDDITNRQKILVNWNRLPESFFNSGVMSLDASSGCPYQCSFCNFMRDRRLMFVKPMTVLLDNLKEISKRGVRYIWFVDDNFRLGSGDINSFCRLLIDENIRVHWMSFIRASTLRHADFELMKASGCIEVQLGLESADQAMLTNMNKKADASLYSRVVRQLLAAGINCTCYFIFGFPGETDKTVRVTQEFIQSIEHPELDGVLSWSMYPFLLTPMSPIYEPEMRKKFGLSGFMSEWSHMGMDSGQAKKYVMETFLKLDHSGAIYREDNLDLFYNLSPQKRKQFVSNRQKLAKKALATTLEDCEIKETFKDLF